MDRTKSTVAFLVVAVIAIGALALSLPVEAGSPSPFPISCANVLCAPCPPGTVPAPPPKNPKSLADCCKCVPGK